MALTLLRISKLQTMSNPRISVCLVMMMGRDGGREEVEGVEAVTLIAIYKAHRKAGVAAELPQLNKSFTKTADEYLLPFRTCVRI